MYGMDQIVEINTDAAYAVVEPGVGMRQAGPRDPAARIPGRPRLVPARQLGARQLPPQGQRQPPRVGHRLRGPGPRGGAARRDYRADRVEGVRGNVSRTGLARPWGPLPDLRGIFMNACGTLGVITKMASPHLPVERRPGPPVMGFDTYADAVEFMKTVSRANLVEHMRYLALGPLHHDEQPGAPGGKSPSRATAQGTHHRAVEGPGGPPILPWR